MIRGLGRSAVVVCLLMAAQALFTNCYAQEQEKQEGKPDQATQVGEQKATTKPDQAQQQIQVGDGQAESDEVTETKLGLSLLKNIALD
jgi:uncharacterized protein YggE